MPSATVPGFLVDAYGRPAVYGGQLYVGTRDRPNDFPRQPDLSRSDYISSLSRWKYQQALADARWIATQSFIAGGIRQKSRYVSASGWRGVFMGEDTDWGNEAEEFLDEADKLASVRGPRFPFAKIFELGCQSWDSDGGFFLLTTATETGFPQFQALEAHRIGQREESDLVDGGPYDGARIINGIIYNEQGAEIAARVLGSTKDRDEDISARDLWHCANPQWFSEGRPLPNLAPAILDIYSVHDGRESQQKQNRIDSKLTLIETTASGRPDLASQAMNPPPLSTPAGLPSEVVDSGMTRFVKTGHKVEAFQTKRPSGEWMAFDDKTLKAAFYAMGWRAEMMDPALLSTGAPTRGFMDIINTTILGTFMDLRPYAIRARQYQIAKAMKSGRLRKSDEWFKWGIPNPPEFTTDPSRSISSDIEGVRAGVEPMPAVHGRWGWTSKQVLTQQARYLQQKAAIAKKYDVKTEDLGRLDLPGDLPAGGVREPKATLAPANPTP